MSGITTGTALAIGLGASAAGGIASGVLGYEGAQGQASAANNAAQLQYQLGEQGLGFQEGVYQQQLANEQPWLQTGGSAELEMAQLLGLPYASNGAIPAAPFSGTSTTIPGASFSPGPSFSTGMPSYTPNGSPYGTAYAGGGGAPGGVQMSNPGGVPAREGQQFIPLGAGDIPNGGGSGGVPARTSPVPNAPRPNPNAGNLQPFAPWTTPFSAPTAAQAAATPGEQFITQQGEQALQNQFSASGELLDPNEQRAMAQYAENNASTYYQQAYNNALQQYQQSYNIYQNNQANQWNRLASLAGMGQTSVAQLNSAGNSAAGNVGNILLGTGAQVGQNIQNAAAANASGYNAIGNAFGGGLNNLGSTLMMGNLLNNSNNSYLASLDANAVPSY